MRLTGIVGDKTIRIEAQEEMYEKPELTIFAVKTQDLARACRETAPVVGGGTVMTMQNGLQCDAIARRFFAPHQVVGCVAYAMVTFLEPGRIECQVRGWLTVGDPYGPQPSRLRWISENLRKAMPVRVSNDIMATRRTKLIGNLNNALPTVTGRPLQEIYFSPSTSRLPLRLMREGIETLSTAGARMDRSPQALAMRVSARLPETVPTALFRALARTRLGSIPMFGSTWQSIVRGSSTEIDYLNGEIVALGAKVGRTTPYNERVVRLVHEVERSGEFHPLEKLWPV